MDNKGLYYCHIRDFDNSIEYHNRSLEIKPQYVNALNNKGLAYYHLGKTKHDKVQYKEAIKCYEDAINIEKNNLDVLNNKGNAFLNYDWYDEAYQML